MNPVRNKISNRVKVKKEDMVVVITGKDRGKRGKVLKVFPQRERLIVEGLNLMKRHTRPNPPQQQGGIVEKEAPLHISNVMLYCSKCNRAAHVGRKLLSDGTKVRYCRRCGEMVGKG